MRSLALGVSVVVFGLSACTRWSTSMVLHQPHEVGRQMIGQPSVAESTSGSIGGSYGLFGGPDSSGGAAGAAGGMLKRTYCVQQAEIQFDQAYETTPRVVGRGADVAGGVILGLLGLALLVDAGKHDGQYDDFSGGRQDRTSEYTTGAVMGGIGGALLVYSLAVAPRGPAPVPAQGVNHFTRSELVEAQGCQLPGQAAPAPAGAPGAGVPGDETAVRLQKLDALRASGTITEDEYQQKRKAILDGL